MRPRLRLIKCHGGRLGWNVFLCSSHAKSKTTFALIPTASLVRAWVPDPGITGLIGKSEETCLWNQPGSGGAGLCDHVGNYVLLQEFPFFISRLVAGLGHGTLPGPS